MTCPVGQLIAQHWNGDAAQLALIARDPTRSEEAIARSLTRIEGAPPIEPYHIRAHRHGQCGCEPLP